MVLGLLLLQHRHGSSCQSTTSGSYQTPNEESYHRDDVFDTYVPPLELLRDKNDILFTVSFEEGRMCLPGQKGERLRKRKVEELWRPSGENDSRTIEDEEASKASWTPGSNAA